MDYSPPGFSVDVDFLGKNTEQVAISPGIFLTQEVNPNLLQADRFFTTEPVPGKPLALLVEVDKLSAQKLSQMGSIQPAVLGWFNLCPPCFLLGKMFWVFSDGPWQ